MSAALAVDEPTAPLLRLGLIGSPNCGKTTLFNALTGLRARVGNFPGVTVERREAEIETEGRRILIVDLPGTYGLRAVSPDEEVVNRALAGEIEGIAAPDALVVVADACALERSLLLVAEVMALGPPVCLVLTMVDELHARGGRLDLPRLEAALGIPVIPVVGHRGIGLGALRERLGAPEQWDRPPVPPPQPIRERAGWADSIVSHAVVKRPGRHRLTEAIDRFVLHPVAGTALFALVMVTFFQAIFAWAAPAMELIDGAIGRFGDALGVLLPAGLARDFLIDGIVAGVGGVVIFLPQIMLLFLLLSTLENLGYMARAAFVIDRVMGRIGLEGRSFVALLSSFACAIPGIMATRSVPSPKNRLVTILVSPLMTCSARLPVYALLIAAFVPDTKVGPLGMQGLVLLGLYLLGSVSALLVAAVLKKTVVGPESLPFYMELPPYRVPTLRLVILQVWDRAWAFLRRAGTIILAVSMLLWLLLTFPRVVPPAGLPEARAAGYALEHSAAGRLGHAIEPLIAPLGFDWKIGVGLVASLAAREVIVATLAQIYAATDEEASLRDAIRADRDPRTGEKVFTPATVASLLVFFVFALQCMSTLAIMRRETGTWRWPAFAFGYLLVLAYGASFATYRLVGAFGGAGPKLVPAMNTLPRNSIPVALLAVVLVLSGCSGARYSRETFHESRDNQVILRSRTDVNPRYEHPATISAIRMAHILASLDVRFDENEKKNARSPAIPVESVYPLGELVAKALAAADETEDVVVMAKRRTRTLKLFTTDLMTAFSIYMKNDQLYIHVSRVDWAVPKNPNERIQEPRPDKEYQRFKVLPSRGILPVARQVIMVEWRDDSFRRPQAIRVGAGGKVKRRTILMEEPEAEAPKSAPTDTVDLSTLTPDALRALADLEEQRRQGAIGEAEYRAEKRKILAEGTR